MHKQRPEDMLTESDTARYYCGIRILGEDKIEYVIHKVEIDPNNSSKRIYKIVAVGTKPPHTIYDKLDKFMPVRIHIYYEDPNSNVASTVNKRYNDRAVIKPYKPPMNKNLTIETACALLSEIRKNHRFDMPSEDHTQMTKLMDEVDKEIESRKQIPTYDPFLKILGPVEKTKWNLPLIFCWSLSLFAAKNDEDEWDEEDDSKDNKKRDLSHVCGPVRGPKIQDRDMIEGTPIDLYGSDDWMHRV